jgi:hypothetical protein
MQGLGGRQAGDSVGSKSFTDQTEAKDYARGLNMQGMANVYSRFGNPEKAMQLETLARQGELQGLQIKSAKRSEAKDVRADEAGEQMRSQLDALNDPDKAMEFGMQLFNSDTGRYGQGEFKGVKVGGAKREDGSYVFYDQKDATRNMVMRPEELRAEVRSAYLEKLATDRPEIAFKLFDADIKKAEKAGDREHALELLQEGHRLGMIKQKDYLAGLERLQSIKSGGGGGLGGSGKYVTQGVTDDGQLILTNGKGEVITTPIMVNGKPATPEQLQMFKKMHSAGGQQAMENVEEKSIDPTTGLETKITFSRPRGAAPTPGGVPVTARANGYDPIEANASRERAMTDDSFNHIGRVSPEYDVYGNITNDPNSGALWRALQQVPGKVGKALGHSSDAESYVQRMREEEIRRREAQGIPMWEQ